MRTIALGTAFLIPALVVFALRIEGIIEAKPPLDARFLLIPAYLTAVYGAAYVIARRDLGRYFAQGRSHLNE